MPIVVLYKEWASGITRVKSEIRAFIPLAVPMLLAQLSQTLMGFIDLVMAGQVSAVDLAAVAIGSSIWLPLFFLFGGLLFSIAPSVAQLFGAGRMADIGPLVRQGLWIALVIGPGLSVAVLAATPILEWMGAPADNRLIAEKYLQGIAWGFPAFLIYNALRGFSEGIGRAKPIMVISLIGLALNVPANYIFIYGLFGLPAMGGAGCGWATAVIFWFDLFALGIYILYAAPYRSAGLSARFDWPDSKVIAHLVRVGLPIGFGIFVEISMFSGAALILSRLGNQVVAGHQIVLNFASLLFMVPLAIGLAATVRVGKAVGERNPEAARLSIRTGTVLALVGALINTGILVAWPGLVADLYTQDFGVRAIAIELMFFAAIFQLPDGQQVALTGALRGFKDTLAPMVYLMIAYWAVALPLGWVLSFTDLIVPAMGAAGMWVGMIFGLLVDWLLLLIHSEWRIRQPLPQLV